MHRIPAKISGKIGRGDLVDFNMRPTAGSDDSSVGVEVTQSGLVMEDGLLIYRTGHPLPVEVVENIIRRSRQERIAHILCEHG